MEANISRTDALSLLQKYNKEPFHIYHGLTVEGDDINEAVDPVTPNLRAIDAINPMDRCFSEALSAGVTTVITGPGSSNPIAGQMVAIKTYGTRIDNIIIKDPVSMKFSLGENPKNTLSFNKLPLLANALKVPVYKLFVFTDSENNKDTLETLLHSANDKEINAITDIIKTILAIK